MSAKPRVVVADDKDRDRAYLVRLAEDAGCEVVGQGRSGNEAIRLAEELKPALVLTDYVMPEGGDSAIAWKVTTVPVIIVPTDMQPSWKETAEDIGPHVTMLDKSDWDGIIAAIKRALGT